MTADWLDTTRIQQHSLDMRQFIDFRQSTLPNGMRIIDAYNSSGLHFTILPDRGLDIWTAHYNGIPLTWIAPGSPHPADYGQSWLGLFNGGLLTTCGLDHVGPPEDGRDIHGDYTRLRAGDISLEMSEYAKRLGATMRQSTLFGCQLSLKRTYTLSLGHPTIHIFDEVTNDGDQPAPFMLLYHCNFGYPLIREGTEFQVVSDVYPRDDAAKAGVDNWHSYDAATPDYAEQVFFHHVRCDADDACMAALINDPIGLEIRWNARRMPYLTQWKHTRQGIYVCGIEPGNCIPEGQNAARDAGRLVLLEPGEKQTFDLTLTVLDTDEARARFQRDIDHSRQKGEPVAGCNLDGYTRYET